MDPEDASESVAEKFTRAMNATPSPIGALSDVMAASVISGAVVAVGFFVIRRSTDSTGLYVVLAVAALPLLVSLVVLLTLGGSRAAVVSWLASLPFPIENLNTLLAGSGDTIEVVFEASAGLPPRADLQPKLEAISEDLVYIKDRPELHLVEIRLGVIDSKRVPFRTSHARWVRMVAVVEQALVPLSKTSQIEKVTVV